MDDIIAWVVGNVAVIGTIVVTGKLFVNRPTRDSRSATLRYGYEFVGLAGLMMVAAVAILVLIVATEPKGEEASAAWTFFGCMAFPATALVYEVRRRQVVLDDEGITVRGWFGSKTVLWNEVTQVTNSGLIGRFLVRDLTEKVRVNHQMGGLEWFIEECRKRLDPEVYGKELEKPISSCMPW